MILKEAPARRMTNQEVFDHVARHLLEQGARSVQEIGGRRRPYMCNYRGARGLSCAVGCLIPDALYDPSMEGDRADDAVGPMGPHSDRFDYLHGAMPLLRSLQEVHDEVGPLAWKEALFRVATRHDLDPAVIKEGWGS